MDSIESIFKIFKLPVNPAIFWTISFSIYQNLQKSVKKKQKLYKRSYKIFTHFEEILTSVVSSKKFKNTLPDANIICRFSDTASCEVATNERSFRVLKLTKSFLRNRIGENKCTELL